jgi:hypothetical protein
MRERAARGRRPAKGKRLADPAKLDDDARSQRGVHHPVRHDYAAQGGGRSWLPSSPSEEVADNHERDLEDKAPDLRDLWLETRPDVITKPDGRREVDRNRNW